MLTFAGSPAAVRAGAVALAATAVALIDMRRHHGVHPRIGAIDVVPFVPLAGATLKDCAALARETAAVLAAEHEIPVYLYGAASREGAPRTLSELRAGQFEGLLTGGLRRPPDFGPSRPHPTAGATAVGAREPLIAFNMLLDTAEVETARAVARVVRESSGGLPAVQALGLFLAGGGAAQVSTNLLDYRRTSLITLVEAVRAAAHAIHTRVVAAELVGLAPAEALAGLAADALPGMPDTSHSIESRLAACAG